MTEKLIPNLRIDIERDEKQEFKTDPMDTQYNNTLASIILDDFLNTYAPDRRQTNIG